MNVRVQLNKFLGGKDVVVIVKCADVPGVLRGKYVVGRHQTNEDIVAIVFDAEMSFHPAIARKYRLVPLGGGYFAVDHKSASIHISGKSERFGAEPNRSATGQALEAALPTYRAVID